MSRGVLNGTDYPNACALARYRLKCPTDICKSGTGRLRAACGYPGAPGHSCSIPLGGPGFPGGTNWLVYVVPRSGNTFRLRCVQQCPWEGSLRQLAAFRAADLANERVCEHCSDIAAQWGNDNEIPRDPESGKKRVHMETPSGCEATWLTHPNMDAKRKGKPHG